MTFPVNVYLVALVSACLCSLVSLPLWRRWCVRVGLVDDPGRRKIHDTPTPLAGGLAVMSALLLPMLAAGLLLSSGHGGYDAATRRLTVGASLKTFLEPLSGGSSELLRYGLNRRAVELAGILVGAVGMLTVGLIDDAKELRPGVKFIGQFLIALLVAASGARITLFVPYGWFHYAITILWILTVINAFNFMDNMNGLCTGLGVIGAWYFAMVAAAGGQYLVALIAFLTCGALLGFLPYNFPKARAFLGDSGSHLVGYLLAVLAILPHFYNPQHQRKWAVLIPLVVLAVPLFDLARVVLLRWRIGQPFYIGDNNHLSHRLVKRGLTRTSAVLAIWLVAALLGALVYLC